MRTVYATQFRVLTRKGDTLSGLAQALMEHVTGWVTDRYARDGISIDVAFDGTELQPKPNHRILASVEAIDDHAVVTLEWSYPHEPDQSLLWSVQITLAVSNGEIEIAILIRITSTRFAVQPIEYELGRPRLVLGLLGAFSCRNGPIALPGARLLLDTGEVRDFATSVLLNQNRTVPVVVVSPVVWTDETVIDAASLHDTLAGLAIVAQLESKWAAFELTEAIGRVHSCYNGAVRVYWPGLRVGEDDGLEHHLFLPAAIHSNDERGRPLGRHLFRMFSALGAFRFTDGEVICRARDAIEKGRRARFDAIAEQAKSGDAAVDKELLEFAISENTRLEKKSREDQARIAELEDEIAAQQANLAGVLQYQREATAEEEREVKEKEESVDRVVDALNEVAERCGDVLVFYKSARDSAEKSDFARPDEVMKALLAIADVGRKYFKAKESRQSMGPFDSHFVCFGLKYAPTDSEMPLNLHGDERKFTHDGRKHQMFKHLRLGKGDRKNCLQIYFEPNDKTKRIEIGYCGRHLSNYGMRT